MSDYDNDQGLEEGKKQLLRCHLCSHLMNGSCASRDCRDNSRWDPRIDTCDTCVHGGMSHSDCEGCESAAGSYAKWASRCKTCVYWHEAKCWNTDCCIPGSKDGNDKFEKLACIDCPFWKDGKCTADECKEESGFWKKLQSVGASCKSCVREGMTCNYNKDPNAWGFCLDWKRKLLDGEIVDDSACMKPSQSYVISYFIPLPPDEIEKQSRELADITLDIEKVQEEKKAAVNRFKTQIDMLQERTIEISHRLKEGTQCRGECTYQIEDGEKIWRDEHGTRVIKANTDGAPVQKPKKAPLTPEEKERKKEERKAKREQEKAEKELKEKLTGYERPLFSNEAQDE